jgi:hypothetical protein
MHHVTRADPIANQVADNVIDLLVCRGSGFQRTHKRLDQLPRQVVVTREREVWLNAPKFRANWPNSPGTRVPTRDELANAIKVISVGSGPKREVFTRGTQRPSYYVLDSAELWRRARDTDACSEDEWDCLLDICDDLPFASEALRLTDDDRKRRLAALRALGNEIEDGT